MAIYAWGSNGSSQLGIGHQEDVSTPTLHIESKERNGDEVQTLAAGGNHTMILYKSGHLDIIGNISGSGSVTAFGDIKLCSATWDASFLLTRSGQLITFGIGERGELGLGPELKQTTSEQSIIDLTGILAADVEVVQIASGVQHTVAVLSNGEAIGWGNGRKGQLGQPADVIWKPRRISDIGFKVKKAMCGQGFTVFVGDPEHGECIVLGQDKFGIISNASKSLPGWKDIGASWGSIFVLFQDGHILSWGRNDHGQLAWSNLQNVEQIAIGSEHALALTSEGRLYAWGWGEHGNCGPDIDENGDVTEPREIKVSEENRPIKGIGAGCATSWFWS